MCEPLTLLSMAASVGGGVMNGMAQKRHGEEINRQNRIAYERSKAAREAEILRQQGFENQSRGKWDETLAALSKDKRVAGQDAATEDFLSTFDERKAADAEGVNLSDTNTVTEVSGDVAKEVASRIAASADETRKRVASLAKLSSYGSVGQGNNRALGANADLLATINGMRQGSLGASHWEQSIQPGQVQAPNTLFGDILSGIGQLGMGYAGTFGGAPGTTVPLPRPNPLRGSQINFNGLY
jgi:hypothetical protein